MACTCATTDQLNNLYEQFGETRELKGNESLWFKIKTFFTKFAVGFCIILLIPYMLYYVIRHGIFGDGRISVAHFFGFREKIVK